MGIFLIQITKGLFSFRFLLFPRNFRWMQAIHLPLCRVILDILCNTKVIILIANHMVMERFLPRREPQTFCNGSFPLLDDPGYRRGDLWSPVNLWSPVICKRANTVRPYDVTKQFGAVLGAHCNKICTLPPVIVPL